MCCGGRGCGGWRVSSHERVQFNGFDDGDGLRDVAVREGTGVGGLRIGVQAGPGLVFDEISEELFSSMFLAVADERISVL